jgi:dihydrofolate reductase
MSNMVVSQFMTLDGVVEDPGGAESFDRGGWAFQFERGPEGDKFKLDEVMEADALLLGRVTYQAFAEAWPSREGEFADKFNNMPKYVVSTTLDEPEWNNSTVIKGDVVLGSGKRLFNETSKPVPLKFVDKKPAGQTQILTYHPAREQ